MMVGFFYWWLSYAPDRIIYIGKKTITLVYNYFSVPLLFRTLFDPWKKDEIDTTNMALDDMIKVWFANLISRLVGAAVRTITIMVGILIIAGTFLSAVLFFAGFILAPIVVVYMIVNGLTRLA